MLWQAQAPLPGIVDLYYADMDDPSLDTTALGRSLSLQEQARAKRYRFDLHRRRFIIGRGALRYLLSDVIGCDASELTLVAQPAGKPAICAGPAFNVSHSEQHLLIGIAAEGRLGVDIEVRREHDDAMALARCHFCAEEIAALEAFPPEQLSAAFLRIWTRKESLLKALGVGLSQSLDGISVDAGTGQGNCLRRSGIDQIDPHLWSVQSFDCHPCLEASVAWDQPNFACRLRSPQSVVSI